MSVAKPPYSNMDLVARVDQWPYYHDDPKAYQKHMESFYYFMIKDNVAPIGYIHESVIREMSWPSFWDIDHANRLVTLKSGQNVDERTLMLHETLQNAVKSGRVRELTRMLGERFSVVDVQGKHHLDMDGCGVDAFGVISFAVHMIGFVVDAGITKYWVPRRSRTRMSYPGMLDNTVGGSLSAGKKPIDCIVRECREEISVDPDFTRANIKSCGTLSYQMARTDAGNPGCQQQVQYLYEMEFREGVVPRPGDGEVEELHLMTLSEVRTALASGYFKLNCAMTWLAFLIRHGHVAAENEENFWETNCRLHRRFDLFIL